MIKKYVTPHEDSVKEAIFHNRAMKKNIRYSFSHTKRKHIWKPNSFKKSYYSNLLNKKINLIVTKSTIKKIEDYSGFDNYILKCPSTQSKSHYHSMMHQVMKEKQNDPKMQYYLSDKEFKCSNVKKHAYINHAYNNTLNNFFKYQDLSLLTLSTQDYVDKRREEMRADGLSEAEISEEFDQKSRKGQFRGMPKEWKIRHYKKQQSKFERATEKLGNYNRRRRIERLYYDGKLKMRTKPVRLQEWKYPRGYE
eukprot:Mrub_08441.p1 GENE.Mrub_08441~~Mrub_08441.p1  ORF type:complete len:274 (+),score=19.92 Mrub_08441:71-823(+)